MRTIQNNPFKLSPKNKRKLSFITQPIIFPQLTVISSCFSFVLLSPPENIKVFPKFMVPPHFTPTKVFLQYFSFIVPFIVCRARHSYFCSFAFHFLINIHHSKCYFWRLDATRHKLKDAQDLVSSRFQVFFSPFQG